MANTTFVNLTVSGSYTSVHIRQFITRDNFDGTLQVNADGLFLTTEEFASLMFQLRAIEQSLCEKSRKLKTNNEQGETTTTSSKKRSNVTVDTSTITKAKRTKKQDDNIMMWYAKAVKTRIEELLRGDCFGCMMNLADDHKCEGPVTEYVDQYFDRAMMVIDGDNALKELKIKNGPSKLELIADANWCKELKEMIKTL